MRPLVAGQELRSLCDLGYPLILQNRGFYQSSNGTGELLLVAHVANRPVESFLEYRSVALDYRPDDGLLVTLTDARGAEETELIPSDSIRCAEDAMELDLPGDVFYLWASVGVKSRRLRLQVTEDGGLLMQQLWEEKGMVAVVMPVKFTGDGWASFPPYDPVNQPVAGPGVTVPGIGDCQDLSGDYSTDGVSVRLDGSLDRRSASDQFFRPEVVGNDATEDDDPAAVLLRVLHSTDGGIVLHLVLPDGQYRERTLSADTVTCEAGQWLATGKKDRLPAFMLLTGSIGSRAENLQLFRDREGALLVHGTFRSGGLLFLIPTGTTTEQLFMRFPLLANQ
ncbi:MAG: hypothetical protein V2I25_14960 [Woeseiaceae bacterium]|nr:hypothetical protein [Woeseiaceae bacterium]